MSRMRRLLSMRHLRLPRWNGAYRALQVNNGYYGESFVELGFLSGGDWVNLTNGRLGEPRDPELPAGRFLF